MTGLDWTSAAISSLSATLEAKKKGLQLCRSSFHLASSPGHLTTHHTDSRMNRLTGRPASKCVNAELAQSHRLFQGAFNYNFLTQLQTALRFVHPVFCLPSVHLLERGWLADYLCVSLSETPISFHSRPKSGLDFEKLRRTGQSDVNIYLQSTHSSIDRSFVPSTHTSFSLLLL